MCCKLSNGNPLPKPQTRNAPYIPVAEARGFTARFDNSRFGRASSSITTSLPDQSCITCSFVRGKNDFSIAQMVNKVGYATWNIYAILHWNKCITAYTCVLYNKRTNVIYLQIE